MISQSNQFERASAMRSSFSRIFFLIDNLSFGFLRLLDKEFREKFELTERGHSHAPYGRVKSQQRLIEIYSKIEDLRPVKPKTQVDNIIGISIPSNRGAIHEKTNFCKMFDIYHLSGYR